MISLTRDILSFEGVKRGKIGQGPGRRQGIGGRTKMRLLIARIPPVRVAAKLSVGPVCQKVRELLLRKGR